MGKLLTLDAHAHLAPNLSPEECKATGAVLAMTLSLDEAEKVICHGESYITWGVGCHPRKKESQAAFNVDQFLEIVMGTAVVGEIGLDSGSTVPLEVQRANFRTALEVIHDHPRLVSIHSYRATGLVLVELRRIPVSIPVLHWWTSTAAETSEAVELGCYFSIHSAIARHSKFRTRVPPERILVESGHGYRDPPAAIPCRIEWVENLVAQQLKCGVGEVRRVVWCNLARIIRETDTLSLLPSLFARLLCEAVPPKPIT